jgi:hypothetical protein
MNKGILAGYLAITLVLVASPFVEAAHISRTNDADIENTNIIDADDLDAEFDNLVSKVNSLDDDLLIDAESWGGIKTFTSQAVFSSGLQADTISEKTAATGVTIDSVLHKDGVIKVPGSAGYTPTANGEFGYDSTSHTYDVYVNGSAKSLALQQDRGMVYLNTFGVASNVITITGMSTTYDSYKVVCEDIDVGTDGDQLWLLTSTAGDGTTFDTGATDYYYSDLAFASATAVTQDTSGDPALVLTGTAGTDTGAATSSISLNIEIPNPGGTTYFKKIYGTGAGNSTSGGLYAFQFAGQRAAATDIDAIRIKASTGNIVGGSCKLYGLGKGS